MFPFLIFLVENWKSSWMLSIPGVEKIITLLLPYPCSIVLRRLPCRWLRQRPRQHCWGEFQHLAFPNPSALPTVATWPNCTPPSSCRHRPLLGCSAALDLWVQYSMVTNFSSTVSQLVAQADQLDYQRWNSRRKIKEENKFPNGI